MLQPAEDARIRRAHLVREALEVVLLVGVIFFAIRLSLGTFVVDGISMQPNLIDQQYMVANKLSYVFGSPQRGDIVILDCHPLDPSLPQGANCVKRVIGTPGDTIDVTLTTISVNGHILNEPYIVRDASGQESSDPGHWTLKSNQYFVMGDNRPYSWDSRRGGPITRDLIIGKVFAVFWPLNKAHGINTYPEVFKGV